MGRIKMVGDRYGKLTVIEEIEKTCKERRFLCRCDCGNLTEVRMGSLRSGNTESCGCLIKIGPSRSKRINHTNKRYGKLVAIKRTGTTKGTPSTPLWLCKCDCGNETTVRSSNLLSGHTKSCGCLAGNPNKEVVKGASKRHDITKKSIIKEIIFAIENGLKRPTLRSLADTFNTTHETIRHRLDGKTIKEIQDQVLEEKENE